MEKAMTGRAPLISIIVPVYNAEEFLSECVESIEGQTYRNIEIILVDDGSEDGSGKLCDGFASKYGNVRAIHQKNAGQMKATIAGLSLAAGEYAGFVDSDDYVESHTYERMMESAVEDGSDIVSMAGVRFSGKTEKPFSDKLESGFYDRKGIESYIIPNLFSNHDLYGNRGIQPSKCLKIFRSSLIRKVYGMIPNDIEMAEDLITSYTAIINASSMTILDRSLIGYHYRLNPDSISWVHKKELFRKSMKLCSYLRNIEQVKDDEAFQREIDYETCFFAVNAFLNEYLMKNENPGKERKEELRRIVTSADVRKAASGVSLEEIKAPNRMFISLMRKERIGLLHFIGMTISLFRKPITVISQKVI